jgi:hypothetical protein
MGLKKMTTVQEVVEFIESLLDEDCDINWKRNGYDFENLPDYLSNKDLCEIYKEDIEGGEGEGDYYHIVYRIKRDGYEDTFIKFIGNYCSWNGVDWYNPFEITHQEERTILVWV